MIRVQKQLAVLVLLSGICSMLTTCQWLPGGLARITVSHVVRVAAVPTKLPPVVTGAGITPYARALINQFAGTLGARVEIRLEPSERAVRRALDNGAVEFALFHQKPGIFAPDILRTPSIASSHLVAIVKRGKKMPQTLMDLSGGLVLSGRAGLNDWLDHHYPAVDYRLQHNLTTDAIVKAIAAGQIRATLVTRKRYLRYRRYYPDLRKAFRVPGEQQKMYWAFNVRPAGGERGLYYKAVAFIARQKATGKLGRLQARYRTLGAKLDFFSLQAFAKHYQDRLPRWRADFKQAATRYGIDWRFLAALSYQESRWSADAVSSTGVRGLMMLTQSTASAVGVDNRRNPQQSINGGARYYLQLKKRLPTAVAPPDRKWFALAAYNVGYGHILDARRLLERRGKNPNLWEDLEHALLLLAKPRYAQQAVNGRARGKQVVEYVSHIRAYYDMLRWMTRNQHVTSPTPLMAESANASPFTVEAVNQSGVGPIPPIRSPMF